MEQACEEEIEGVAALVDFGCPEAGFGRGGILVECHAAVFPRSEVFGGVDLESFGGMGAVGIIGVAFKEDEGVGQLELTLLKGGACLYSGKGEDEK